MMNSMANVGKLCRKLSRIKNRTNVLSSAIFKNMFSDRALNLKNEIKNGPSLQHFLVNDLISTDNVEQEDIPYIDNAKVNEIEKKVYFYVYGCQMNVNDTEIVWSVLKNNNYSKVDNINDADVVLIMTCSIRDGAEHKIWNLLGNLKGIKGKRKKGSMKIGILGCMAERLKEQLIEKDKGVDLVAGPDSYKDLPRLLASTENNQTAINVLLSLDETYANIMPVRLNENSKTAFVSIMRGCDNMCTYCIVPFTRGRERSRPVNSILEEVKHLSDQGVKEITLLGQNVNSYRDLSDYSNSGEQTKMAKGFKTVYKTKKGGLRFSELLDKVSEINSEMRIRFTSPHPKDFPDEVLEIIKDRPNICKSIHLPAQSGNNNVLERMRRGYTRESYLELVNHIRSIIPSVALSSDFICGFCHETDEEFNDTLTLIDIVKYNTAFLYPYSMREKTTAHRRFVDDVPEEIKQARHKQMTELYRKQIEKINKAQIGEVQLILIEGASRRSDKMLVGKNDGNTKVIVPSIDIPLSPNNSRSSMISSGDYIAVKIVDATSQTLRGAPLYHTTVKNFDCDILNFDSLKQEMNI